MMICNKSNKREKKELDLIRKKPNKVQPPLLETHKILTKTLILNPKTHREEIKTLKMLENLKVFLENLTHKIENQALVEEKK